jgi:hypothetical protein
VRLAGKGRSRWYVPTKLVLGPVERNVWRVVRGLDPELGCPEKRGLSVSRIVRVAFQEGWC